jgi:hypothetical protein
MSQYAPPSVSVDVLNNPRIISNVTGLRLLAIVGLGPMVRNVIDEAVTRGTGSTDNLSVYASSGCSLTQVASIPGINAGAPNAILVSSGGQLYQQASASLSDAGQITWVGSGQDVPTSGATYYVKYTYNVPASQFSPSTYSDKSVIQSKFGKESNQSGILTIGGSIALENGAPEVVMVQASGSAFNVSAYQAAIDKLQKLSNIEQIAVVFPSGSVTKAQQETVLNYAYSHTQYCNTIGRDRGIVSGSPSPYYTSDGFDTIGDTGTPGTYLYRSNALKSADHCYMVPSRVRRYDQDGNLIELDGNFLAIAVAGLESAQLLRSTPLNGFTISGVVLEDDKWQPAEENQLGGGNCTVIQSVSGNVTIRDWLTTDPTSADTQEPTVRAIRRLVRRTLSTGLYNAYTNKGLTILPETPSNVAATTAALLQSLVSITELKAYGKQDDASTGETKISAQQDSAEPRRINVTCSVAYAYPLKWISVTVSTYVG